MRISCAFIILLIFLCRGSKGQVPDHPLKLHLLGNKVELSNQGLSVVWVAFVNSGDRTYTLVLPGRGGKAPTLLFLEIISLDNGIKEVELKEQPDPLSVFPDPPWVKNLEPGDSILLPLIINDNVHSSDHPLARHETRQVNPGYYLLRVWYYPWNTPMSKTFFHGDQKGEFMDSTGTDPHRPYLPNEGIYSHWIPIKMVDELSEQEWEYTEACPEHCRICKAVERGNWNRVEKIIGAMTSAREGDTQTDDTWLQPHRNILWVSPPPDAILSSLPTYTERRVIFRNSQGFHFFHLTWQLGIIYPIRSRFHGLFPFLFSSGSILPTSSVDHVELIGFEPY